MNPVMQVRPFDPDHASRLDAEFEAELKAGTIPSLQVPPIDPASDPFGRGFSWLQSPSDLFDLAFDALVNQKQEELLKTNCAELRTAAMVEGHTAGIDDDVIRKWACENFSTLCLRIGPEGEDLLEILRIDTPVSKDILLDVMRILELQPTFAALALDQRVAAALITVAELKRTDGQALQQHQAVPQDHGVRTEERQMETGRRQYQYAAYISAAVAAACVFIGLKIFGERRPLSFELNVQPTSLQMLGTDRPQPTVVSSPMTGFVAAVAVTRNGEAIIWPTEGGFPGNPVTVRQGEQIRVGPLLGDVEYVAIVVTEQPATAALIQEFKQAKVITAQVRDIGPRITDMLRGLKYRDVAVGLVQYPR